MILWNDLVWPKYSFYNNNNDDNNNNNNNNNNNKRLTLYISWNYKHVIVFLLKMIDQLYKFKSVLKLYWNGAELEVVGYKVFYK